MATYTYRRWSGGDRSVEADAVTFYATHVVFTFEGRLVLGERRAEQVNELRIAAPEAGDQP